MALPHRLTYVAGRLAGVVTRPLFLFLANNGLAPAVSQGLAISILGTALAMASTAADPHRRYYATRFAAGRQSAPMAFFVYLASLVLLAILGAAVVAVVGARYRAGPLLVLVAFAYFATEKLADEMLRVRLFERDLAGWGALTMRRATAQLGGLGILLLFAQDVTSPAAAPLVLLGGNLVAFLPQLPRSVWRLGLPGRHAVRRFLAHRAVRTLAATWLVWLVALAGASTAYVDRVMALVIDSTRLPLYLLIVMCFSVVPLSVDFFYVSRHRQDFLQHRLTLSGALFNRELASCAGGGLAVALAATVVVLMTSKGGATLPLPFVVSVGVIQCMAAMTTIPREISYWSVDFHRILRVEGVFWILVAAATVSSIAFGLPAAGLLGVTAAASATRFVLHARLSLRVASSRPVGAADTMAETAVPPIAAGSSE